VNAFTEKSTNEAGHVLQLRQMVSSTHTVCVMIANLHEWPRPGILSVCSETLIRSPMSQSNLHTLEPRHLPHPANPVRGDLYPARTHISDDGQATTFGDAWIGIVREFFNNAYGDKFPTSGIRIPQDAWRSGFTAAWAPVNPGNPLQQYATIPAEIAGSAMHPLGYTRRNGRHAAQAWLPSC